jgi:hypothetical protein
MTVASTKLQCVVHVYVDISVCSIPESPGDFMENKAKAIWKVHEFPQRELKSDKTFIQYWLGGRKFIHNS